MHLMKTDMSGGAAVLAAMKAIAALKPEVAVVGVVPLVENMPGGRAMRPGDVVRSAEGKTVEVLDTDAEGRLILADALWYARQLGATHLVDVATLTGAIGIALGRTTTRAVRHSRFVGRAGGADRQSRGRSRLGACRSSRTTANSSAATSPTWPTSAAVRRAPSPRRCS